MSKFIIDCDPGHDDAVAILFAARHLDLIGITTVHCNSSVTNTTRNALAICEAAGIDLPVAKGEPAPLEGPGITAPTIHGKSGLDGAELQPATRRPVAESAVDFIIETATARQGELVIIAVAPLTNIARALEKQPALVEWVKEISIMGGSTSTGNVTPAAEFNTFADPEAARLVYDSGIPIRMVGLNVTLNVCLTAGQIADLRTRGGQLAREISGALAFYRDRQDDTYGRDGAPMHDVCAVIPYSHPDLIQYRPARVQVETRGEYTRGMTVCDLRPLRRPEPPNARVAMHAAADAITELVLDTLVNYS